MRYFILLLILFFCATTVSAQIFPTRCFILAPEFRRSADTTKGAVWLRQQGFWGNLAHGFNSTGDRYYWSIATGGIIQFVEWEHSALYFIGDAELAADQHSDIFFHPRANFWTEGIFYTDKLGETEIHVGYINRCHHDIDNLDKNIVGAGEERTLIYSSIMEKFIWRDVDLAGFRSDLWAQFDEYVFHHDYITPIPLVRPITDVEQLNLSISAGGKFDLFTTGIATTYIRAFAVTSAYNSFKTLTLDGRAELGIEMKGDATAMNLYLGYESLQDDFTRPVPANSHFLYLGIRLIGRNIGL